MATITNILEATADAARTFVADQPKMIVAVHYEYDVPGVGTVRAQISREDVRKAFAHGLISCPVCGDPAEYCSTFTV